MVLERETDPVLAHPVGAAEGGVDRGEGGDEGAGAAELLGLGDGVQRERRLARAFGSVNLDDAAASETADAERHVQPERARGDHFELLIVTALTQAHDRAFAERTLNLTQRAVECLGLVHRITSCRSAVVWRCRTRRLPCHSHEPAVSRHMSPTGSRVLTRGKVD